MLPPEVTFALGWASCAAEATSSSLGRATILQRHAHVYRDGKLVVKWELDNKKAMKGAASRRVRELIAQLESAGLL